MTVEDWVLWIVVTLLIYVVVIPLLVTKIAGCAAVGWYHGIQTYCKFNNRRTALEKAKQFGMFKTAWDSKSKGANSVKAETSKEE